jgi:hypothetical protein
MYVFEIMMYDLSLLCCCVGFSAFLACKDRGRELPVCLVPQVNIGEMQAYQGRMWNNANIKDESSSVAINFESIPFIKTAVGI